MLDYTNDLVQHIKSSLLLCEGEFENDVYDSLLKLVETLERNLCLKEEDYYQFVSLLSQHKTKEHCVNDSESQVKEQDWEEWKQIEQEDVKRENDKRNHLIRTNYLVSKHIKDIRFYLKQGRGFEKAITIRKGQEINF